MNSRGREAIAPAYLILCLILGGSSHGFWGNMILQLLGVGLLVWAMEPPSEALERPAQQLLILAATALVVIGLQLIPLPANFWPHLGGREGLATDYRILGIAVPSLPVSLTPYQSLDALLEVIPPLAIFCAIVRLRASRPRWLAIALLAGTVAGVLVGLLQVSGSFRSASPWYFYAPTGFGVATGFFANASHMAMLLVIPLPFLSALLVSERGAGRRKNAVIRAILGIAAAMLVVGIALNRSFTAYALSLPVIVATALILLPRESRAGRWGLAVAIVLLVAAVLFIWREPIHQADPRNSAAKPVETRELILKTSERALTDFLPFGSGLGSFPSVYRLYEMPDQLATEEMLHARNDYLELALELGIAGILLMLAFLAWWCRAAWSAWHSADAGPYARAASIASAAILMQSFVDFPLRTPAISTTFLMCLALLIERDVGVRRSRPELWPTRHVVIT